MSTLEKASTAVTAKTLAAQDSQFQLWVEFCAKLGQDPALSTVSDPETKLCFILIFAGNYRTRPGRTGEFVRADTVSKACSAVGKGISYLGGCNPTKQSPLSDKRHPLLTAYIQKLEDEDGPSGRAYPINLAIIEGLFDVLDIDHPEYGPRERHIADLCIVAWFWLMRPAEYSQTDTESTRSEAFRLMDVQLVIDGTVYPATAAPLNDPKQIDRITSASLTFDDQKSAVRGEQISQRANNHPILCGAKALGRLCRHLLINKAAPDTPLHKHYNPVEKKWYPTKSQFITNALQHSARLLEESTGIPAKLCTARGIRPGAATALLCAGVDVDRIGLLGRWRSEAMLRYLRIQAANQRVSQQMLDHGRFTFAPGVYQQRDALPQQAPNFYHQVLEHVELYDL